jgi:hypothetical protein
MFNPGQKVYEYEYNNTPFSDKNGIKITTYTVKECKDGRIYLTGGYGWSIRFEQIGRDFFASKESLYIAAIRSNIKAAEEIDEYEDVENLIGELRRLGTKLKALQKEDDE